jgi:hypothetical protein
MNDQVKYKALKQFMKEKDRQKKYLVKVGNKD